MAQNKTQLIKFSSIDNRMKINCDLQEIQHENFDSNLKKIPESNFQVHKPKNFLRLEPINLKNTSISSVETEESISEINTPNNGNSAFITNSRTTKKLYSACQSPLLSPKKQTFAEKTFSMTVMNVKNLKINLNSENKNFDSKECVINGTNKVTSTCVTNTISVPNTPKKILESSTFNEESIPTDGEISGFSYKNHNYRSNSVYNNSKQDNPNRINHNDNIDNNAIQINKYSFRHLIFGPNVSDSAYLKHLALIQKGLFYSTKYLKKPSLEYVQSRQVLLENHSNSDLKTLVLDLDETLISSCSINKNFDKVIQKYTPSGFRKMGFNIRPYAKTFLKRMAKYYEIIIFTASSEAYAKEIVLELDPTRSLISYILDRKYCLETKNGLFIKDLRILKNRELRNIVIVDNLIHSFGLQLLNGIPILEWTHNQNDLELKYLENYLIELSTCNDIPTYNQKKLRLLDILKITEKL